VERKFETLFGRIRAMLKSASVNKLRSRFCVEFAMTVKFLLNVISVKNKKFHPYELLLGCKPKLPMNLRSFGDIGAVTTKVNNQCKLKNKGKPCMFVEYSVHHAIDF
jgi:hypothetical protein